MALPSEPAPLRAVPPAAWTDHLRSAPDRELRGNDPGVLMERERRRLHYAKEAREAFPTLSWDEIVAEPQEPPPVIRPGVPEVGVTVVAGAPKVGKTLWVMQMALESARSTLLVIEESCNGSTRNANGSQRPRRPRNRPRRPPKPPNAP